MSDELPLPEVTPLNAPYWQALRGGRLVYPACDCGCRWLPVSPECPGCLRSDRWQWLAAIGTGQLVSWVVYRTAYHPAFRDRVPYNVAIVELDEGPRLISNVLAAPVMLSVGLPLRLQPRQVEGLVIPCFVPLAEPGPGASSA